MAFLLAGSEAVLDMVGSEIGNIASTALPYLEKEVKNVGTSFVAKEVGQYADSNKGGFVDTTLQKIYQQQNHKRNHPIKQGRKKKKL